MVIIKKEREKDSWRDWAVIIIVVIWRYIYIHKCVCICDGDQLELLCVYVCRRGIRYLCHWPHKSSSYPCLPVFLRHHHLYIHIFVRMYTYYFILLCSCINMLLLILFLFVLIGLLPPPRIVWLSLQLSWTFVNLWGDGSRSRCIPYWFDDHNKVCVERGFQVPGISWRFHHPPQSHCSWL